MNEAVANYYTDKVCNLMHQYPNNQVAGFLGGCHTPMQASCTKADLSQRNKTTMLPQLLLPPLYKTPSSKIPRNKTSQSMLNGLKTLSNWWTGKQMAHHSKP
jgi:hypothetical protein